MSDFKIGDTFKCGSKTWKVTDMGTRTVVAICIHPDSSANDYFRGLPEAAQRIYWKSPEVLLDPVYFSGPPYPVAEHVFDEEGIKGCTPP